jgi:hypothetical protein
MVKDALASGPKVVCQKQHGIQKYWPQSRCSNACFHAGRMINQLGTLYLSLIPESHSNHTVLAWWISGGTLQNEKSTLLFFQKIDGLI